MRLDEESREFLHALPDEQERQIARILLNRKLRDAAFRKLVLDAYEDTCAITRLKVINGGGKAEVQAAHIRAVEDGGPDVVQNGLALTGTLHWLFDRGLISISDDYHLLVAHNRIPADAQKLFDLTRRQIKLPSDRVLWPARKYLAWHREKRFECISEAGSE